MPAALLLGIDSEMALVEAWTTLHRNVRAHRPDVVLDGVLVERMGEKGVELIVGGAQRSGMGTGTACRFGGVLAETIEDVRLLPADLSPR